jgi:hypothetical protein
MGWGRTTAVNQKADRIAACGDGGDLAAPPRCRRRDRLTQGVDLQQLSLHEVVDAANAVQYSRQPRG